MDITSRIRPELAAAISDSYEAGDFTTAIKEAIAVITETLRDKSGLDGDGEKLVGAALGFTPGKSPLIKINELLTETDRSIQNGLLEVLKGIYKLIRNPRSHERIEDTRETADAIILFVNYLLSFLGESQQSFTIQDFIERVTEEYFFEDEEYVEGLVEIIPIRKRVDTLIAVYKACNWNNSDRLLLVINSIMNKLSDSEIDNFYMTISDDLQREKEESKISLMLKLLPPEHWVKIQKITRLRIESMIMGWIKHGMYLSESKKLTSVGATWSKNVIKYFLRQDKVKEVFLNKLENNDFDHNNYVVGYFLETLPDIFITEEDKYDCILWLSRCIEAGNKYVKDMICFSIRNESIPGNWIRGIIEELKDLTDDDKPELFLPDGTAFLGKFEEKGNPFLADIPF